MLATFANTFKIPELRKRILLTAGLVFISRLISMIPTPGVNLSVLNEIMDRMRESASGSAGGLMSMFDVFTGGAMSSCSVGFLSIWPYISASIILQLLTAVVPALERMVREGDSGRQRMNQYTRYLTIGICLFQSFFLAQGLQNPERLGFGAVDLVTNPGVGFTLMTMIAMTSASMFVMWLGDQITARGIGNGVSLIIMINICSRLPHAVMIAWERYIGMGDIKPTASIFELVLLLLLGFAVTMGTVMLTQGVRRVPIHSTRRVVGNRTYGGQNTYMPLRVNYTGVMPIIFAGPLITFPATALAQIDGTRFPAFAWLRDLGQSLSDPASALHLTVYAVMVLFFCFFWVATQFNAMQIADNPVSYTHLTLPTKRIV